MDRASVQRTPRHARLLEPPIALLAGRLLAILALTWLPLLLLSAIDGTAAAGARVPFLFDVSTHVRLLIALPMMVAAEPLVHRSLRQIVRQFSDRGLIAPNDHDAFEHLSNATVKARSSLVAELALLALSTVLAFAFRRDHGAVRAGMWYLNPQSTGAPALNAAGWWYSLVSLNVFRLVILRWYYRLAVWYRFLWRTSRLPLRLNPLHPDRAGGLAFLDRSLAVLTPVFAAQTIAIAGEIGSRVLQDRTPLDGFPPEVIGFPILFTVIVALPLTFFSLALKRTAFHGVMDYGTLSSRYVDAFRSRWMERRTEETPELLGTADIQSLADLGSGYDIAHGMRAFPAAPRAMLVFIAANALPFLPLALTVIPLKDLVQRLIGALL